MKRIFALIAALAILPITAITATAQESYKVKPGDVLRIEVLEDSSINRDALVLPDGQISVPLAGSVAASGRTLSEVKANIASALAPNFANDPTVFVSLSRIAQSTVSSGTGQIDVYVLGEVNSPGKVSVDRGTTLLQMLAEIGGFSKFASKKRIQLRRTDASGAAKTYNVNYNSILSGASNVGMTVLSDGDVVIVPERKLFE